MSQELDDLELLMHGALGRPPRYAAETAGPRLHLPTAVASEAKSAGALELVDPEGVPLASVSVEATYPVEADTEVARVGVVGSIAPRHHVEYGAFRTLYLSPEQVAARTGPDTVTVPTSSPLSASALASISDKAAGRPVLLLALTGHGTPSYAGRPLSSVGLIRATLVAAGLLDRAQVVAVPLASRGPGRTADDQRLRAQVVSAYAPGDVLDLDAEGGPLHHGELPAPVRAVIERELPGPADQGLVLFFTGLSGSGKSTLARALHDVVLERGARTITSLDGDVVRRSLSAGLTFSRADRETNIRRIGWVAAEISRHRGIAVCSPIAPFDATRKQVRTMVHEAGGAFFLIHVSTPAEECERRDRKGLYARARRGEIPEFTGISSPYEEPEDADVRVDTTGRSIDDALGDILAALDEAGYLPLVPSARFLSATPEGNATQ